MEDYNPKTESHSGSPSSKIEVIHEKAESEKSPTIKHINSDEPVVNTETLSE